MVIRCGTSSSSSRRSSGSGIGGCGISGALDNHLCPAAGVSCWDQWLHPLALLSEYRAVRRVFVRFGVVRIIRNIVVERFPVQEEEEVKGKDSSHVQRTSQCMIGRCGWGERACVLECRWEVATQEDRSFIIYQVQ